MPINRPYEKISELPIMASVFPLKGVLLLPGGELPLNVFEPRYVAMIDDALGTNRLIGMIQPRVGSVAGGTLEPLEDIGCLGRITQISESGDGRYMLNLTGVARFRVLEEISSEQPYRLCKIGYEGYEIDLSRQLADEMIDRARLIEAFRVFAKDKQISVDWSNVESAPTAMLVNAISMMGPFKETEKQMLLEAVDLSARADALIAIADPMGAAKRPRPSTLH